MLQESYFGAVTMVTKAVYKSQYKNMLGVGACHYLLNVWKGNVNSKFGQKYYLCM